MRILAIRGANLASLAEPFELDFERPPLDRYGLFAISGPTGAGKSTMLKIIGLLERATRGQVWVNGRNLNKLRSRDIPYHRREVGMIFQDHRLLDDRTVSDNVALPLVAGYASRKLIVGVKGRSWFERKFLPILSPITITALLVIACLLVSISKA